jgi:hypothetical protein
MTHDGSAPRSRRALLAAAAGGAAALAASAALPLSVAATDPNDVVKGADNSTTATTSITNATADSTAFAGAAAGTGYGLQGTSAGGAGLFAWSISAPPTWAPSDGSYTGVYGWSPASPDPNAFIAVGVQGQSDDWGVFGSGTVGVYGFGTWGVVGESATANAGVMALGASATDLALDVRGKAKFSRSGVASVAAGSSSRVVTFPGVTVDSQVLAVMKGNRSNRWVRAVVPVFGKFTIYLNAAVTTKTYISFFIID